MAGNTQKLPVSQTIPRHVQGKIDDAFQRFGKSLPCSITKVNVNGSVTINFELADPTAQLPQITVMPAQSKYVRHPFQVGDKGVARAADIYIGGITNLGGGTADLTQRGNLATLVFDPVADANWTPPTNANQTDIQGPQGVNIHDAGNHSIVNIGTASITLSASGHSIIIGSGGVTIDGKVFLTHEHVGVTTGIGNTGTVL